MSKVKKVISILCCIVLSFSVYVYICAIVTPKDIKDSGGVHYFRGMGFLAEPKNSIDIMFYGNSDVYSGIMPSIIFEQYGFTSYASGRPLQTVKNINLLLQKTLETQKPKVAILETDCFYTKSGFQIDEGNFFLSPLIFHSRWKELKLRDFTQWPTRSKKVDINKGFLPSKIVYGTKRKATYMGNKNTPPKPFPSENDAYIKEFVQTCRDNDIEVLFLELPSANSWNYAKHNYVKSFAKELGVKFIDMNIKDENFAVNLKTDFRDNGNHMNSIGAYKTSKFIGRYLSKHYSNILKDKRQDKEYADWQKTVNNNKIVLKDIGIKIS